MLKTERQDASLQGVLRCFLAQKRGHAGMKIATYNVNGVNGRLPVLLRWLAEAASPTSSACRS